MWWRSARAVMALAACLSMAACGFHPLYGERRSTPVSTELKTQLGQIYVNTIDDRKGQILHNALEERLHADGAPTQNRYRLQITLQESVGGINYEKNATASEGELNLTAKWDLFDFSTGKRLTYGHFSAVDTVEFLGPRYGSVAAERDSEERALLDIADMITDRLAVYLRTHKQ